MENKENKENKVEHLLERLERSDVMSKISTSLLIMTTVATLFTIVSVILDPDMTKFSSKEKYECVGKKEMKNKISTVIKNNGDLEVVKKAFNARKIEKCSFLTDYYYDNNGLTVLDVLDDLEVDLYEDSAQMSHEDSIFLNRLNSIMEEYTTKNPFEDLEKEQRLLFQSVQTKLGDNYKPVAQDMLQISNSLKDKNQLTEEYLNKANSSFWISIGAVAITLLLGLIQLWQNTSNARNNEELSYRITKQLDVISKSINEVSEE
jgi:hypothetical protein